MLNVLLLGPGYCSMTWEFTLPVPHETEWTEQLRTFIFQGSTQKSYSIWALKPNKQFRQLAKTFKLLVGLFNQVSEVAWMVFTRWLLVVCPLHRKQALKVLELRLPSAPWHSHVLLWMVWLRNSFVPVDWCMMIQSRQANIHQLPTQWKCQSCFCWYLSTARHPALEASSALPTAKDLQD